MSPGVGPKGRKSVGANVAANAFADLPPGRD